jgi:hypothetical protein
MRAFRSAFFLILCILCLSFHFCNTTYCYSASWNPLKPCRLAENPLGRLSNALEDELAGQVLATRAIEKAVARNIQKHETGSTAMYDIWQKYTNFMAGFPHTMEINIEQRVNASKMKPLLMHFSGPTGELLSAVFLLW